MNPMSRMSRRLALVMGAVALSACGDDPVAPEPEVIEEVEFAASLGIDLDEFTETASGLYYRDTVVGTGDAAIEGDEVKVEYVGYFRNGQEFDASADHTGGLDPFTLGANNLILGFDEGVRGMRLGGERRLIIPPELAYGEGGPQGIRIFDLELVSLTPPDEAP